MTNLFLMPEKSNRRAFIVPNSFSNIIYANSQVKMTLLNSHQSEIVLGVDQAQNVLTASSYMSLREISSSCNKIQSTPFYPTNPVPEHYKTLNLKYGRVQSVAGRWNKELALDITNSIPKSILTFHPLFSNVSDDIIYITSKYPDYTDITSQEDKNNIVNALSVLIKNTKNTIVNTSLSSEKLSKWVNEFTESTNELHKESDIIITQKAYHEADRDAANDAIKKSLDAIEQYKSGVTTGQVLVGVGAGIIIAGLGLLVIPEPTMLTKIAGGILVGVGVILGASGGISWGVYEHQIKEARRNIATQNDNIRKLDMLLSALTSLKTSITSIEDNAKNAVQHTTDFLLSWDLFNGELINLRDRLASSTQTINSSELRVHMKSAKIHWENSYNYSKNLLRLNIKPIHDPVADIAV